MPPGFKRYFLYISIGFKNYFFIDNKWTYRQWSIWIDGHGSKKIDAVIAINFHILKLSARDAIYVEGEFGFVAVEQKYFRHPNGLVVVVDDFDVTHRRPELSKYRIKTQRIRGKSKLGARIGCESLVFVARTEGDTQAQRNKQVKVCARHAFFC